MTRLKNHIYRYTVWDCACLTTERNDCRKLGLGMGLLLFRNLRNRLVHRLASRLPRFAGETSDHLKGKNEKLVWSWSSFFKKMFIFHFYDFSNFHKQHKFTNN